MELYHQILALYLASSQRFTELIDAPAIVEGICYRTLNTIRSILMSSDLSDEECFLKIEQIVQEYEQLGSNAGSRHDFG